MARTATTKKKAATTAQKRVIRKSTMKITSRRKKRSSAVKLKTVKFDRSLKKMRTIANRSLKKALKGVTNIRSSVYNKVDRAVARELPALIDDAVISVVNDMLGKSAETKPTRRRRKTATESEE